MKAKNIGIAIAKKLNEIGVFTLADLAEMTPKIAYQKICDKYPEKTIPKCYYLYSLQGALLDLDWRELRNEIK
ncbi:TfoX/Sxy family DNA transformation protein [Chryseobacterium sp. MFBS3-17]|uniref:TfoX/Sxy family DNA transformation protein n=1 Tax=Chryseobacterium sp. MFBS3-17 TaxID=2886689 RepID=UPI001D0E60BC|nr:TfoX/Sxy family DNA transformation protein [Chryseobacterium sp. MFBS3-17]MCC2589343.1 TfoX/Sxy family protein [Chryseobacterium sp. MFBS3-17]